MAIPHKFIGRKLKKHNYTCSKCKNPVAAIHQDGTGSCCFDFEIYALTRLSESADELSEETKEKMRQNSKRIYDMERSACGNQSRRVSIDVEKLASMLKGGASLDVCAGFFKCSTTAIRSRMSANGLKPFGNRRRKKKFKLAKA